VALAKSECFAPPELWSSFGPVLFNIWSLPDQTPPAKVGTDLHVNNRDWFRKRGWELGAGAHLMAVEFEVEPSAGEAQFARGP
jgi:hypothetical protein